MNRIQLSTNACPALSRAALSRARRCLATIATTLATLLSTPGVAGESLLLQSTTSTANSGLYEYLLPRYKEQTGVQINVVAVGTGQAIRNASNCDGDVLLVHARTAEEKFVADGFGVVRHDLMYNDFIVIGPQNDPAGLQGTDSVTQALSKIAETKAIFASRGDNSGTHKKELQLWQTTEINTEAASGSWYRETGAGMGATLNTAVGMGAYTLTDRATWLNFKNRQNHLIVFEGDQRLFNQYGVILVSPAKCPRVKSAAGQAFIDWLTGTKGQQLIESYTLNGEQLFYPNAN